MECNEEVGGVFQPRGAVVSDPEGFENPVCQFSWGEIVLDKMRDLRDESAFFVRWFWPTVKYTVRGCVWGLPEIKNPKSFVANRSRWIFEFGRISSYF